MFRKHPETPNHLGNTLYPIKHKHKVRDQAIGKHIMPQVSTQQHGEEAEAAESQAVFELEVLMLSGSYEDLGMELCMQPNLSLELQSTFSYTWATKVGTSCWSE